MDPSSSGRELGRGALSASLQPKNMIYASREALRSIFSTHQLAKRLCILQTSDERPPHITGHRANTVTLGGWLGGPVVGKDGHNVNLTRLGSAGRWQRAHVARKLLLFNFTAQITRYDLVHSTSYVYLQTGDLIKCSLTRCSFL